MKDLNYVEEQLNLLLLRITWSVIPAVFFFLVDVSMNAVKTGATSAASSAISQAIADVHVSVDIFITTQTYVDIASISVVPRTTGGQVYYYHPFSAVSDSAKLYNDLRWNVSRLQRLEAVMRVRCSQGLQVQEYLGNFCKRIPTDADLPAIDCDNGDLQT